MHFPVLLIIECMKNLIDPIVKDIHQELLLHRSASASLYLGQAGTLLFQFLYARYQPAVFDASFMQQSIEAMTEDALLRGNHTFCSGLSGVHWLYTFLYNNGLLETADWEFLCTDDDLLADSAIAMLEQGNYDFLHGALGIAWQLLYKNPQQRQVFFDKVFALFDQLIQKSSHGLFPHYVAVENISYPQEVNLSLSHGMTSVLKFCLECYQRRICIDKARLLAENIIRFLQSHTIPGALKNNFADIVHANGHMTSYNRLAWCYGDMSMGLVLYQAGVCFNNRELCRGAHDLLLKTTERRNFDNSSVYEPCFCHGSSGLAYMYLKMGHYTKDVRFEEAAHFWLMKTIGYTTHTDGRFRINQSTHGQAYINEYSLLEGMSGIGLTMLSFLTRDFSWDYCLMLN
jgi:lantibiotic biosynthesis protein